MLGSGLVLWGSDEVVEPHGPHGHHPQMPRRGVEQIARSHALFRRRYLYKVLPSFSLCRTTGTGAHILCRNRRATYGD